jgi:ferrochelatase
MKRALLLVNLGTPDAPTRSAVRRYLTEFLNDPYVIDIPQPWRFLLVNLIIIPFRLSKSTRLYRRVWTAKGSPILYHLKALCATLQETMPDRKVYAAMRYGAPSLPEVMQQIHREGVTALEVVPLYPQYAASTTETIIAKVVELGRQLPGITSIQFVKQFYDRPEFITAFVERVRTYDPHSFDHVIFSFHSLPERHLDRIHPQQSCASCSCVHSMPEYGKYCYKATSYETARRIASALNLDGDSYSVSFQSRFAKKWIGPFTEDRIKELAQNGTRRVLVVAPSFVADCLETIVEIGMDYKELFEKSGGEELVMVESVNSVLVL